MSKLANLSAKKVIKALERLGYSAVRIKGSHVILKRENSPPLIIPRHKEVAPHLIKSQLKRAGISVEEFLKNL